MIRRECELDEYWSLSQMMGLRGLMKEIQKELRRGKGRRMSIDALNRWR